MAFDTLQRLILTAVPGTQIIRPDEYDSMPRSHQRLIDALGSGQASCSDIAVLVRHVMRRESLSRHGQDCTLEAPVGQNWPSTVDWERFSVSTTRLGDDRLRLSAREWCPEWVANRFGESPESKAVTEEERRFTQTVAGDAFLTGLGQTYGKGEYLSNSQKDAVRSVILTPAGGTLLVNLPTGYGKSLCAHVLAALPFADETQPGLTVVVVPTVALALDQARVLARLVSYDTAYLGGNDLCNREIRRRIRSGEQQIVFTAPESLLGTLRPAIYAAARDGYLKSIVIDEAHMVSQWGDSFRSSFQEISGLRRALLRCCQQHSQSLPRTILLSATLTRLSIQTLERLFGEPGPFGVMAAVQLRPEPSFWVSRCQSRREKHDRVLDAIHHLPRPLIVYTTRVDHARSLHRKIQQLGFKRVGLMTGETQPEERSRIINDWATDKIDVMVATSAFGLGIDKADVRCVIHACVPETLDRFYQEVGRSGRDGKASMSLVVYYEPTHFDRDNDRRIAASINDRRLISAEKGFPRWQSMIENSEHLGNSLYKVSLTRSPGVDAERIDMYGRRNEEWNARTLTLMARAGMIEFDDLEPPMTAAGPLDDGLEPCAFVDNESRVIRILDELHTDEAHWAATTQASRQITYEEQRHLLRGMFALLNQTKCAADVFAEAYTIAEYNIEVAKCCGGCASCRSVGKHRFASPRSSGIPWDSRESTRPGIQRYLAGGNRLVISLPTDFGPIDLEESQLRLVHWLSEQGVRLFVCNAEFRKRVSGEPALRFRPVFFEEVFFRPDARRMPTAFLWPHRLTVPRDVFGEFANSLHTGTGIAPMIMIVREDAVDPERPDRLIRDTCFCITLRRLATEFMI